MIIYRTDIEQGTPKWFAAKEGLWSGSVAIKLLQGKNLPPTSTWGGNSATRRGHMLEVVAIREYERKYRRKVFRPGGVQNTVYTNAWYSPDGIDGSWLLECKSFNGSRHENIASGKIPLEVLCQIYFGMIISGKRKARLLVFNPEYVEQLTVIEIKYDKVIGNNIRQCLRKDMKNRRSKTDGSAS